MAERRESTEALQKSLVQCLEEIIKAPDDEEVAQKAAETLHELDQRLARNQHPAEKPRGKASALTGSWSCSSVRPEHEMQWKPDSNI
ncbi:hypothetical protein ABIE67_000261 [Streptomyces sp. V4I8]|uniref:hypothetical protein n=1 Tax=Streptomyces sp. V4I8 TaxID=3156469 RepID=UPI003511EBE5